MIDSIMYSFYENPPKTRQDVYDYITSWLQPVGEGIIEQDGPVAYQQIAGFRRANVYHETLYDPVRKIYVFMTIDDNNRMYPMSDECATYNEMIDSAVTRYCHLWKIA